MCSHNNAGIYLTWIHDGIFGAVKYKDLIVDQSVDSVDVVVKIVGGNPAVEIGHHNQIGVEHAVERLGNQAQGAPVRNYIHAGFLI
jgi:hypothetical protein